jgi:SAM-dependent methyltransferase
MSVTASTHDAAFAKYHEIGAYHWREVSGNWIQHHAYTAERYRRTLAAAGPLQGRCVLDYGCGDGALLNWICRRVGPTGQADGYDPNPYARDFARQQLALRGQEAQLFASTAGMAGCTYDVVISAEVIEHVYEPELLLAEIRRLLKPGGRAVITTPIRLTERPEDSNHIREWFPGEFQQLVRRAEMRVEQEEQIIPAAAAEVYYWRPRFLLRFPIFRICCNLLSIYLDCNALSALAVRPIHYWQAVETAICGTCTRSRS